MIELTVQSDGIVLPVRVTASARRNQVGGVHAGQLKVRVSQAPERGKANKAVVELVSRALGLRRADVQLLAGATSPRKRLLIRGTNIDELRSRLATL